MPIFLQRQINTLKKMLLSLGALCEEQVRDSIEAVVTRDVELAQRVVEGDKKIDLLEIEIEEECLHTLALHQPVAFDLRYVVAVLKMNNDLERIGDHAKSIAEQAKYLAEEGQVNEPPFDLNAMGRRVEQMLRHALDAVVNIDVEVAHQVRVLDDEVDIMHASMYGRAIELMRENPHQTEQMVHYISVSRQLERIADHACNIAKDVLYITEGEIPRHGQIRRENAVEAASEGEGENA
ncbi:phosphate signaling complex protein PhoU [Algisphaera agarilytica]|uniref:Phosphate-specific transport system accessory protein PhoU n=1 Tax=Algisphaera agarilytica TaxID=1385975 RepID=A0A7X0H475_9BACT|nr:phosphate signaling complex protein PhoU [Algisphaera agarilytica]MBB6428899.1 phosphate transport system protein [Algisphaera agarilytica]